MNFQGIRLCVFIECIFAFAARYFQRVIYNYMATLDISDEENEEESERVTAVEVVRRLKMIWLNEKFAPDILSFKSEIVEGILAILEQMESNLRCLDKNDPRIYLHKLEIDRIKFMLTSYLRIRLEKVERFAAHYLEGDIKLQERLSPEELQFAQSYIDSLENAFNVICVHSMPSNIHNLDLANRMEKPAIDSMVFVKAITDTTGVVVNSPVGEESHIMDMGIGSKHLVPYASIVHLVKIGAAVLI